MKFINIGLLLWCATFGLSACNVGLSTPGLNNAVLSNDAPQTLISATNVKSTGDDPVLPVDPAPSTVQSFRAKDGRRVDLQAGYLNLLPLELEQICDGVALMFKALPSPIADAIAHAGHGAEPAGSGDSSGTSSGAINVAKPDKTQFDMGRLAAESGTYCGIRIGFVPIGSAVATAPKSAETTSVTPKHGGDLSADAAAYFHTYPCSYAASPIPDVPGLPVNKQPNAQQENGCVKPPASKNAIAPVLIKFSKPVTMESGKRYALSVQINYDRWFDDVDIAKLETDAGEQAKVVENMRKSFHAIIQ